jgi:hypothetical protein
MIRIFRRIFLRRSIQQDGKKNTVGDIGQIQQRIKISIIDGFL